MADATDLNTWAEQLLAASAAALDTIPDADPELSGAPDRQYVGFTTPALDCCDQLTVHAVLIAEAPTTPGGLNTGKRDREGWINHVTLLTTITRCVHTADDQGSAPTADELAEDAAQLNADAWALWNHLHNLWKSGDLLSMCGAAFFDGMRPVQASGTCAGWLLSLRVRLDGYEEAPSS